MVKHGGEHLTSSGPMEETEQFFLLGSFRSKDDS